MMHKYSGLRSILRGSMRPSLRRKLQIFRREIKEIFRDVLFQSLYGRRLASAAAGRRGLKLNIGCGTKVFEGWLNLDCAPGGPDTLYFNALNPMPLVNDSVARIHCEHFLEHLEFSEARQFLAECHRVLEPGGTMRIIVPDLALYTSSYHCHDAEFFRKLRRLGNPSLELKTRAMVCNQMFRMGGDHKYAWDFETLELVSRELGFSNARVSQWRAEHGHAQLDAVEEWRPQESLYAEISK